MPFLKPHDRLVSTGAQSDKVARGKVGNLWTTALLLSGCLSLYACGSPFAPSAVGLECVEILGCKGDLVCFQGRCVAPGEGLRQISIDIVPPSDSEFLRQLDPNSPRDLDVSQEHVIILQRAVTVLGSIVAPGGLVLSGELRALKSAENVSRLLPSERSSRRATVNDGVFSLKLLPNLYDIEFRPDDANIPPGRWQVQVSTSTATVALTYSSADFMPLKGRVVYQPNTAFSGVANASIQIFSGNGYASSIATTAVSVVDEEQGAFSVNMDARAISPFTAEVRAAGNPLVPTVQRNVSVAQASPLIVEDISLDLSVGNVSTIVKVLDTQAQPQPGLVVVFQGIVVGAGQFRILKTTDEQGVADPLLLPGQYEIYVLPPTGDDLAATMLSTCLVPNSKSDINSICTNEQYYISEQTIEIVLNRKTPITLDVVDVANQPVTSAQVEFVREFGTERRQFSTTTNAQGQAILPLNRTSLRGELPSYKVRITPQQNGSDPLPMHHSTIEIAADDAMRRVIQLRPVSLIFGEVLGPDDEDLTAAQVTFYSVLNDGTEPQLLGIAQTDEFGEFVIPLPTPEL